MSARVEAVLSALVGHSSRVVTVLAVELVAALQERNPVDTGWSRANWLMSIGAPVPTPAGTQAAVDFGAAQSRQADVISGYRVDLGDIHVSNHVPYIRHIGLGGGGFVEDSIAAALDRARSVLEPT